MARMFPRRWLFGDDRSCGREAERAVYEMLACLPREYAVYHGIQFSVSVPGRLRHDVEIDFLVTHEQLGVLVVEVKSGTMTRRDRSWHRDTNGQTAGVPVPDPFSQLRDHVHSLERHVAELPAWKGHIIHVGGALLFPDNESSWPADSSDPPFQIIGTKNELSNIEEWVRTALAFCAGESALTTETPFLEMLHRKFNTNVSADNVVGLYAEVDRTGRELDHLTERQLTALHAMRRNERVLVSGPAGSGKTILAIRRAREVAETGQKVLYTCFNVLLAEYVRTQIARSVSVTVLHFHELVRWFARQAGIPPVNLASLADKSGVADLCLRALTALPEARFDAVLVDEAQDFDESWWCPIEFMLRKPTESFLWIFNDDNQRLYEGTGGRPQMATHIALTENLRNTKRIHELFKTLYKGEEGAALGPLGQPVEWCQIAQATQMPEALDTLVARYLDAGIPPQSIRILTGLGQETTLLRDKERVGGRYLRPHGKSATPDDIEWSTARKFKGLESPVVILVEIDQLRRDPRLRYVALSRGCALLAVIGTRSEIDFVKRG